MNQVVIVGNGFDIAHGLRTRYQHFILDLVKGVIKDGLHSIGKKITKGPISFRSRVYIGQNSEDYVNRFDTLQELLNDDWIVHNIHGEVSLNELNAANLALTIEDGLVKQLITKYSHANWVDIETEFYNQLKACSRVNQTIYDETSADELINQMDFLRNSLCHYLRTEFTNYNFDLIREKNPQFVESISKMLFAEFIFFPRKDKKSEKYERLIVNYNYLDNINPYFKDLSDKMHTQVINIHGTVEDEIIFGFGHVENPEYRGLLKYKNQHLRKSLKNFRYPSNEAYIRLSTFLDKDIFYAQVVGHSCGASDGTTLRKIFDHPNCRSIKLCHLDNDEFDDKVIEIARHCTNQFINDKIYPRQDSLKFPKI